MVILLMSFIAECILRDETVESWFLERALSMQTLQSISLVVRIAHRRQVRPARAVYAAIYG